MGERFGLRVRAEVRERGVDLDLTLPGGVTTAVVGPNGAGKSTLVALVDGELRPDRGRVEIGGMRVSDGNTHLPPHQRSIALLQQRPVLFPHLDVLGNVAFGPRARGASRAAARDRARRELTAVGAEQLATRRSRELSGGQAQRVALARALATDPEVLLLDEPLAALDIASAASMRQLLRERLVAPGRPTTILVTHDPLDVWALADRLVCLDGGRVVAQGEVAELLTRPTTPFLAELVGLNLLRGELVETARGQGAVGPRRGLLASGAVVTGEWPALGAAGQEALVSFEPRIVVLTEPATQGELAPEMAPQWLATVAGVEPRGSVVRVRLELSDGQFLVAELPTRQAAGMDLVAGRQVLARLAGEGARLHHA